MRLELWRGDARGVTARPGAVTAHAFSFGAGYDPANTSVGPLVALNEERLEAGEGYDDHRHSGLDIVSWVVDGELAHRDDGSGPTVLVAGTVGVLRSGRGVVHAEHAFATGRVHFLQSWLLSPASGPPSYDCRDVRDLVAGGGLVPVAAGPDRSAPLALTVPETQLLLGRLAPGEWVELPAAERLVLHLAAGEAETTSSTEAWPMVAGDALRGVGCLERPSGAALRAGARGAEVLLWLLPAPERS